MQTLRQQWRDGNTSLGGWLSLPDSAAAEAMAQSGFDYVCVDMQHGLNDYAAVVTHVQGILLGGGEPIVRVPWNEPGIIGKVLDAGAHGVIIPMVNSVEEAEAAVRACRYAPRGSRSSGPIMAMPRTDGDYVDWANENIACIPMIETVQAVEAIDDILAVDGIDAIYMGPADLSLTLGLKPGNNDDNADFSAALEKVVAACQRAGVVAGIHSTGGLTPRRLAAGFGMVTVTSDLGAMRIGIRSELKAARAEAEGDSQASIY